MFVRFLSLVPLAVLASFFSLSPPFRIFSFWFSIPWFSYISRGRRQLPQAGEVRRPPRVGARRVVLVGSGEGGECLKNSTIYHVLG